MIVWIPIIFFFFLEKDLILSTADNYWVYVYLPTGYSTELAVQETSRPLILKGRISKRYYNNKINCFHCY